MFAPGARMAGDTSSLNALRKIALAIAGAGTLFWLYTFYAIAQVPAGDGTGFQWIAVIPLGFVFIVCTLPALILALVLALLNALVKPLLIFLTFPVTIITLGLFLFVINALIILLAAKLVPGFKVDGFWWALLFSIVMTIINSILISIAGGNNN